MEVEGEEVMQSPAEQVDGEKRQNDRFDLVLGP